MKNSKKKQTNKHKNIGIFDLSFCEINALISGSVEVVTFLENSQGIHQRFLMKYYSFCASSLKTLVHKYKSNDMNKMCL